MHFLQTANGRAMALIYVKQSVWEADFILNLGLINIQYFMLYFSQHKVKLFLKRARGYLN